MCVLLAVVLLWVLTACSASPAVDPNMPKPTLKTGSTQSATSTQSTGTRDPEACSECGGSGRIVCYYCHGSGDSQILDVMGIPTPQGCKHCDDQGWIVCEACKGYGEQ